MRSAEHERRLDLLISLAAIDCIKENVDMLDAIDVSHVEFSAGFYRKRDRVIRLNKVREYRAAVKRFGLRLAVAILIIMSLGLFTVMAIEPLREALFDAIIDWYDDSITLSYEAFGDGADSIREGSDDCLDVSSSVTDEALEDTTVWQELLPPTVIEELRKPEYLPEGVVEDMFFQGSASINVDYYYGNDLVFTFSQLVLKQNKAYIDNETVLIGKDEIKGNIAYIFEYEDKRGIGIAWSDGDYSYKLVSLVYSLEELLKIAESVQ